MTFVLPGVPDAATAASPAPTWLAYPDVLSADDCAAIVAVMPVEGGRDAGLVDGRATHAIRKTHIHWLPETQETAWVYDRLTRTIARGNREGFHYALTGFDEEAQIGRYQDGGFYDWHADRGGHGAGRRRKLTVSIQLSPPDAYEGGALELNPAGRVIQAPRAQGTAVVFPAFALHRVAPVTAGVRHSLVIWTHGPDFV